MPVFFLNGLRLESFPEVYEPSEDSFLLAENVEIKKGCSFLDLGTGSGIQGINAAMKGAARIVCTDVNENALKNAEENAEKAGFKSHQRLSKLLGLRSTKSSCFSMFGFSQGFLREQKGLFEFRQGNLFDCVKKGERFDIIVFNPPYVPSEGKRFVDLDGGKKGREVLDKFLEGFGSHLEKGGSCFFLQSSLNGKEKKTLDALKKKGFGATSVVARKRLFFEELMVFRARKGQSE